ncbi:hypothetical protein NARC_140009 [Candidatus Nitrosocosmicus arcticus]|uniref:Uncharacterized protein n=1 Tax=Candidatus Nitrosocosmicus arcticus TaxID=2035267 RepID=A0A557SSH1_9ARCH|nr:hypothetical protein NARC_140009 [Candidatus Nitrosocosmicus arcticus]
MTLLTNRIKLILPPNQRLVPDEYGLLLITYDLLLSKNG